MVVFTCNHCGDSLHKPKVEKHYSFVCRAVKSLTCVDCLKDFRDEEYATHTKCVTEDERYAAKGTYTNGIVKKGEMKQESWMEMIKSILDNDQSLKPSSRDLLNTISHYNNVPRKKPKFINFIKSSSGGRVNMKNVEDVWNIIEKYKNDKSKNSKNVNSNSEQPNVEESQNGSSRESEPNLEVSQNGTKEEKSSKDEENQTKKRKADDETKTTSKKKKRKAEKEQQLVEIGPHDQNIDENSENVIKKKNKHKSDTAAETVNVQKAEQASKKKKKPKIDETLDTQNDEVVEKSSRFNFQKYIFEVVNTKGSISLKKLQKKVLNAYLKETGEVEVTPKIIKKFNKKLNKIPNLELGDDKVTIIETTNQ